MAPNRRARYTPYGISPGTCRGEPPGPRRSPLGAALGAVPHGPLRFGAAGALTSTPARAAATTATGSPDAAVGYSLGYPVGVTLAIVAVALVVGGAWPGPKDAPSLASEGIEAVTTLVERTTPVRAVPGWDIQEIRMSYLQRGGRTRVIAPGEDLHPGDEVLLVGAPRSVAPAVEFLGHRLEEELTDDRSAVDFRRFVVFLAGARALGLSAPRSAGALAGFVGQPAILAYARGRVSDERIEAGYAALFALGIIAKILAVQVIAVL